MDVDPNQAGRSRPASTYTTVLIEHDEGIAWVTLNRPDKRNAMSPTMNREMLEVLEELELDDSVGVVVLTGAGDSFTAGMDLKEYFRETDQASAVAKMRIRRAAGEWQWRKLRHYPKPTIAMVNGWCFGGGFTPLVACDLAIAADEATFGLSEINWGIIPAGNVTRAVAEVMHHKAGLYYIMTGEPFGGQIARETGLVNESVPREQLRERTRALAKTLLGKNPTVLRQAKNAFKRIGAMDWDLAEDYLGAKAEQTAAQDPEKGRAQGMKQFLDDKSIRPGLQGYRRDAEQPKANVSFEAVGRLLRPRSVAIVGVSEDGGSMGGRSFRNVEAFAFSGDLHLVSRTNASVGGRACVPTIDDLPAGVDAAVLALPARAIIPAIEACARKGIGGVVVYAAGFAESGAEGIAAQARMTDIAREADIAVLGPNTLGMTNFVTGNCLAFGPNMPSPPDGRPALAILAQSGAMMGSLRLSANVRRYAVSYAIATGNEAVTGVEDFMAHIVDDPHTRAIAVFAEQLRRPLDFLALSRRARENGKPVILLHPGRSERARASAASHPAPCRAITR